MSAPDAFAEFLRSALADGSFLKATLSKPLSAAPKDLRNVFLRPVDIRGERMISWTWRFERRDETKNLTAAETAAKVQEMAGREFGNVDLFTTERDATLKHNRRGEPAVLFRKSAQTAPAESQHNREKKRWVDSGALWLRDLGITNERGEPLPSAQGKWRQINKFVEIVASLVPEGGAGLPVNAEIADMGCGKGYLTFALYEFLTQQRGLQPRVTGVEAREDLVSTCRGIADRAGFAGLRFVQGSIADHPAKRLDMLVALHACDTATDEAIARGVKCGAKILLLAPCCHKQVRRDMKAQNELGPILKHGILEERLAEILTDGMRALLLEANGYATKVFEFISTEHTAKNLMISAVMRERPLPGKQEAALAEVAALKQSFGIREHALERMLR